MLLCYNNFYIYRSHRMYVNIINYKTRRQNIVIDVIMNIHYSFVCVVCVCLCVVCACCVCVLCVCWCVCVCARARCVRVVCVCVANFQSVVNFLYNCV